MKEWLSFSTVPQPDSALTVTRLNCAIHCSDQSETMACAYQRLSCAAAWVQASGAGVVADGGRPRHIGRDPLLERAQALLEGLAGERPHVPLDALRQFGGL